MRIATNDAAAFDCRMANAILESERFSFVGGRAAVLTPGGRDAAQLAIRGASTLQRCLETFGVWRYCGEDDMDIRRAQGFLPVFGTVFAEIAEDTRARGHALLELG